MPNWCSNNFALSGPKDKIKALWDAANADPKEFALLNSMVPIGEWDYGNAIDAWGTKWDVSPEGLEYVEDGDTGSIRGWFESAWSPPVQALMTYCAKNEDVAVTLSYFEPGVGFIGRWDSANQVDECYEIDSSDLSNIPPALQEEFDIMSWYDLEEDAA